MQKTNFFDSNAQIGRLAHPEAEYPLDAASLAARLAPLGITGALVHHALAKELHPLEGNPAVLEETRGTGLVPCWVAMPHSTGEMPHPTEFVRQMKSSGVKAVRLFPAMHQWVLSDWCAGEMLDVFAEHRVPVFVEIAQTSFDHIAAVLKSHPGLRLVVTQPSYRCDRYLYPLMEKHAHLMVETSNYVVTGGIEAVCERFGASRLVFGTGQPFLEPGGPVALVNYADISNEDKRMIASGNLERLLEWGEA